MLFQCYGVITYRHFDLYTLMAFMVSLQSYGTAYLVNCSLQIYGFHFYCFSHQEAKQFIKGCMHKIKNIQIEINNFMTFKFIHVIQGQL